MREQTISPNEELTGRKYTRKKYPIIYSLDKNTSFLLAALNGSIPELKTLKSKGTNVNAIHRGGENALHLAVGNGYDRNALHLAKNYPPVINWLKKECGLQ